MAFVHGRFAWYELMTPDVAAAKTFYAEVVGWRSSDALRPGVPYTFFLAGDLPVCGLLSLPANAMSAGARPYWIGYIGVDDIDASIDRAKSLGGTVFMPPKDIPGTSRFSIIADPQMATLGLLKWLKARPEQPTEPNGPGRIGWHELLAADREAAWAFYSSLAGWRKTRLQPGATGPCQHFAVGGETIGGIVAKSPMARSPVWLYHFNVDDIDAAVKRVKSGGGEALGSPIPVPDGRWGIQCIDPQGAFFGLIGKRSPAAIDKPRYDTISVYTVDRGK